jgi:sugar O-acyltransferase (sialic acid O-acetyltransferase NeuD family)
VSEPIVLLGAGGHAKVVLATLVACGHEVSEVLDDDAGRHGTSLLGRPVSGPIAGHRFASRQPATAAIGDNRIRRGLSTLDLAWVGAVHPAATVHATVSCGAGTVILAGAVVQPDTALGAHVIVNTSAAVDHDCRIGDWVHLAPGCRLAGGVRVEEGALLGIGSAVIPGVTIGAWATVGAGAVVLADVAPGSVVAGVPARVVRRRR